MDESCTGKDRHYTYSQPVDYFKVKKKRIGLHRLIERITSNAMMERLISSSNRGNGEKFRPLAECDKPGYRIKQLSKEEREALLEAKPEDFSWRGFK